MREFLMRLSEQRGKNLAVIFLFTVLSFSNVFWNDFFMDDYDFVVNWPLIQHASGIPRFFVDYIPPDGQGGIYSPLRTLLFFLNYHVWGLFPVGYHLFSLLVHLLGTWTVYRIASALTRNPLIAFLTALIFGVHPVHVENVSSITGTMDTAGIVLGLVSFSFWIRAFGFEGALSPDTDDFKARVRQADFDRRAYVWSVVFAVLSIFTHELMLSLPALFLFSDFFFSRGRVGWKRIVMRNLVFVLIAVAYVFCKQAVLGTVNRGHYLFGSFFLSQMVVIKAWARYLVILAAPVILSHNPVLSRGIFAFGDTDFDEGAVMTQSLLEPVTLVSFVILAGAAVLAVRSYRRNPLITFGIGWFFLSLLPVAQIVPSSVYYAERYLYHGSLGFCLIAAYGLVRLMQVQRPRFPGLLWGSCLAVLLVLVYGGRTFVRNFDLRNEVAFYEAAVRMNPQSANMLTDLALVYLNAGMPQKALETFNRAIDMEPDNAEFYFLREKAYTALGEYDNSIRTLETAVRLRPDYPEAYYNVVGIYAHKDNERKARDNLAQAVRLFRQQGRIFEAGELSRLMENYMKSRNLIQTKNFQLGGAGGQPDKTVPGMNPGP